VARTGAGAVVGAETASPTSVDVEVGDGSVRGGITSFASGNAGTGDGSLHGVGVARGVDEDHVVGVVVEGRNMRPHQVDTMKGP
jgi:hypothetical protein